MNDIQPSPFPNSPDDQAPNARPGTPTLSRGARWAVFFLPWVLLTVAAMVLAYELTGGGTHGMWVWNQAPHSPIATGLLAVSALGGVAGLGAQMWLRTDVTRRLFWGGLTVFAQLWGVRIAGPGVGLWLAWALQAAVGLTLGYLVAREEKLTGA